MMEAATALTLIKLSCAIIDQIITVAKRAQKCKDICNDFAKYLQDIEELLEMMTKQLKDDPETRNPLEKLKSLLQESYDLVDSCKTINLLDLLGGGIANQLKEKRSAIERYVNLIPCYMLVAAQKREIEKDRERDKERKRERERDKERERERERKREREKGRERKEKKEREEQDKLKAINSYKALLKENITNYEASWTVYGPKLEEKPMWRATQFHLDPATRERLFREHVDGLHKHCVGEYQSLLALVITLDVATKHFEDGENIISSWSKAKLLLETRERYKSMLTKEREKLLREHVDGLHMRCVVDYRSLLAEVITLDVATKHFENGENILSSWSKAKLLLAPHQKYKNMPKKEREKLLREHVDGLHKHCVGEYQSLLALVITLDVATKHFEDGENIISSWSKAKLLLETRERYKSMPTKEREKLLREHVDGLHKRSVVDYRSLLAKVITLDVATKHFENGENILSSWSKAERLLAPHQKYNNMPKKEREKLLREHVDGLHKHCVGEYQSLLALVITLDVATKHFEDGENIISSWSKAKLLLETHERYKSMSTKEREKLLREYVDGLHKRCVVDYRSLLAKVITLDVATKHFENGENILSSWSKAERLLAPHQKYKNMPKKEREKLLREHVDGLHKHCVGEYQSLLALVITLDVATKHFEDGENIISSWSKAKLLLETRERYKSMSTKEREKLLREHVDGLHKRCVVDYRSILAEVITLDVATKHFENGENILTSWSKAKLLLAPHQKYKNMPKKEREKLLREHVDGLHKLCVQDYRSLLAKVITVDASTKHRKNGNKSLALWSEAKGLLKQSQRYIRMPEKEAEKLFCEYVDGLKL